MVNKHNGGCYETIIIHLNYTTWGLLRVVGESNDLISYICMNCLNYFTEHVLFIFIV
jgi:hypothetical protein